MSVTAETSAVYIYGLNGTIAKRVGSTVLFLLKDHLGSTRVVMDATGLVRSYYDYDAFGNLIRTGTTNEVKYQFTGQEFDESGLHNYRARLYDSDLGKFYAVDPAGQGWSPFAYAGNNPVVIVDRDGKLGFVPLLIIGLGALSGGYSGYQIAEAKGLQGLDALGYALAGAVIGGVSAYYGVTSAPAVGGVFSGGISSAINSFGMNLLSGGRTGVSAQFGPFSIGEKGLEVANPFQDRGALRSFMGWATLAMDLYSAYGHYKENRMATKKAPELRGQGKEVKQIWQDSFDSSRNPSDPVHEEGAWLAEGRFDRVPSGDKTTLDMGTKPDWATASMHTHPNLQKHGFGPWPSTEDYETLNFYELSKGYVVGSDNKIYLYTALRQEFSILSFDKYANRWWLYGRLFR